MRRPDPDDLAYLAGLAGGALLLVLAGFVELRETRFASSNDLSGIWAGGHALVSGADPYDAATWRATATGAQGQVPETTVYGYPAWIALLMAPLGLLPVRAASLLWTVAGLALAAVALRGLLRDRASGLPALHTLAGLSLLVSQPAIVSFYDGQWSFLLLALVCAALVLLARRPARAGVLAGAALLVKPQLFVLALPQLARGAPPRALVAALLTAATAVAMSLVVLPGWPAPYVAHVLLARLPEAPRVTTVPTALFDLAGPAGLWLAALLLLGLAVATVRLGTGDDALAVALATSVAFAPYAWSYDHLLLLVPLVLATGAVARRDRRAALAGAVAGAALLLVGATVLHGLFADARRSESLNGLVPGAMAVLVTVLLWPPRRTRN